MQEKNPLDDIDIDSLIKTHNVKPVSSGVDPWAGFDTPTDTLDKTIAEQTSSVPGYRRGGSGEGLMNKIAGGINEFTGVGDLAAKAGQAGLNYLAKKNPEDTTLQGMAARGNEMAPNEAQTAAAGLKTASTLALPFTGPMGALGAGYAQDVANNIEGGSATAKEVLTPGVGTALGALPGVGRIYNKTKENLPIVGKALKKKTESFLSDLITPELNKNRSVQAIKTGKVEDKGLFGGRDITEAVPFFEKTMEAVREVPGLKKGQTKLESANAIHNYIGNLGDQLNNQIKLYQVKFTPDEFGGFMKNAATRLEDIPSLTRDASEVATKYLKQFDKLVQKNGYTAEGLLKSRREFDRLLPTKKLSPDIENGITEAVRNIRQGANDFLASKVPDVAVKDLLAKQTALYNALDNVAVKAAAEGDSKLQRFLTSYPKTSKVAGYGALLGAGAILGPNIAGAIGMGTGARN